ncbi:MAG: GAF domain-containing protein [Anaerolineales bacterium]|nr:GAF domain-containing protein [Anaerolineales bacterium]
MPTVKKKKEKTESPAVKSPANESRIEQLFTSLGADLAPMEPATSAAPIAPQPPIPGDGQPGPTPSTQITSKQRPILEPGAAISVADREAGEEQGLSTIGSNVTGLTSAGWESLRRGTPIALPATAEDQAILAYARPLLEWSSSSKGDASADGSASGQLADALTQPALLLEVMDDTPQRTWSEDEILLVEQVTDQLSLALENARLFQETQSALQALAVSERYQKSVAQAVTTLTERGIAALADVLRTLGEASQASRTYYFETQVDARGPYWRLISEWCAPEVPAQLGNPTLRRLPISLIGPWLEKLSSKGYISALAGELPEELTGLADTGRDNLWQKTQLGRRTPGRAGTLGEPASTAQAPRAVLQFAIPGRQEAPGCIGLEQYDYERRWSAEEIAALQTAASALANTIAREDLFTQVQINLAETEALYQASARLNSAASYDDILNVLRQHTVLGQVHATSVTINLFDQPWTRSDRPEWMFPVASWTGAEAGHHPNRYPLSQWTNAELLMQPDRASTILDTTTDARLDEAARAVYIDQIGAKSLILAPLNVAGQWIGQVIGAFRQMTSFPEQETRRLMSLAGQAAVAIQNLRLLDESQRRASQLQTAAEIARDSSGTLALDDLLARLVNLLIERFGYYHASIFLVDESGRRAIVRASTGQAGEEMINSGHSLEVGSRSVIGQVTLNGQSLVLNDISQEQARLVHRPNPLLPLTKAELGIPLKIGRGGATQLEVIGALDVQASQVDAFTPDDIAVLQTLADQIAVAVENARAYEIAQHAVEEIREADRLKSQFLANMSHELRTPLNSIIGFSRVILKGIDGPTTDLQQQDLSAIYNSGQHLLGLINDVLDLSKIEAGKMELAFEENVSLGDLIKSVMSTMIGLVKDKPITLQNEVDIQLPFVRIDTMKIRQVLINLFSNAAKFTERGTITVKASIEPVDAEMYPELLSGRAKKGPPSSLQAIVVRVIDTGPGITLEDQSKLFQPFSQVDGSLTRKTGGSGLGLSISSHLIHLHGGQIGVDSQVGQGSTFYFTLPIPEGATQLAGIENLPETAPASVLEPPAKKDKKRAPVEDQTTAAPSVKAGVLTILSIDIDSQVIDLYRRYLSSSDRGPDSPQFSVVGITDLSSESVPKAIEIAKGLQPYAITLDVSMPNSWQVLETIRSDPQTHQIPVIATSVMDQKDKALSTGATTYLMKPILQEEFVQAVMACAHRPPAS